jgi:hypothetical protein
MSPPNSATPNGLPGASIYRILGELPELTFACLNILEGRNLPSQLNESDKSVTVLFQP